MLHKCVCWCIRCVCACVCPCSSTVITAAPEAEKSGNAEMRWRRRDGQGAKVEQRGDGPQLRSETLAFSVEAERV